MDRCPVCWPLFKLTVQWADKGVAAITRENRKLSFAPRGSIDHAV
jgi:hypothetical protein